MVNVNFYLMLKVVCCLLIGKKRYLELGKELKCREDVVVIELDDD